MTEPVFVDSGVFLYALDGAHLSQQQSAQKWRAALWKSRMGRISLQVLNEFYGKGTPFAYVRMHGMRRDKKSATF